MQGGHVLQIGAPEEIYHRPASRDVAAFFGSPNLLEGFVTSCRRGDNGLYQLAAAGPGWKGACFAGTDFQEGERVLMMVRPENLTLVAPGKEAWDGQIAWSGTITESIFRGARRSVTVTAGSQQLQVEAPALQPGAIGDAVTVIADADGAWALRP
jgi:iron(III) transport system ATP-binding protein